MPTGIDELDRVLGGGLVPGSLVLIGGEPGVGKSSLLLQALAAARARGLRTLLVCGEESPAQVRLRAQRLRRRRRRPHAGRDRPRGGRRDDRRRAPRRVRGRLGADAATRPTCGRGAGASPRCARRPSGCCGWRSARRRHRARRPRDQGRHRRRPARARAPGRRRAPVRGRPLPAPARAAGGQEPVRVDRRDRHLRDDGRGPRPGRRPVVGAGRGRRGRAGVGAPAGDRGQAPDPARGAGARGARPTWRCRAGRRPGSTATA